MKSRLTVLFGEVVDREMKHPGEGASRHLGGSKKEASGIRGARAPGRRVPRAFLGQLTLGLGPVWATGMGRLARGTEPGPMVPTPRSSFVYVAAVRLAKTSPDTFHPFRSSSLLNVPTSPPPNHERVSTNWVCSNHLKFQFSRSFFLAAEVPTTIWFGTTLYL